MEVKGCTSSKSHDRDDCGERVAAEHLKGVPKLGGIIWVKLSGGSWWPAVVVESNKADGRLMGDVRVRLYGSYEYMYVDPIKYCSEFQITLEQHSGSYQEIFMRALEQDLSSSKSGRGKGKVTKSKDGACKQLKHKRPGTKETEEHDSNQKRLKKNKQGAAGAKCKSPKQDVKSSKQNKDAALSGRSQELSARRTKVMQTLGLVAPSGSPFRKKKSFI
uniref:PWWP domain-containing protein n=1 Tax=Manihot esculenta TaxID=3983 RepID=A0A251J599_MANES